MNEMPMANRPSSEMSTVQPANNVERPDVLSASTVASSGLSPSWSPPRYRVTMSRA